MQKKSGWYVLLFFMMPAVLSFAQPKRVELLNADMLTGTQLPDGQPVRKLNGHVLFKHEDAFFYCDSSYQYERRNDVEAFDNIRIVRTDSQKITGGEHMIYQGDVRLAQITGEKVILQDKTMFLYTTILDYDLAQDIASYYDRGKVVDKNNTLTSIYGTYYKKQNLVSFRSDVVFFDGKYHIFTDTLEYNTVTKIVYFRGPTRIIGKEGVLNALRGEYDSKLKKTNFRGRIRIDYDPLTLFAEQVRYDQKLKAGVAEHDVEIISAKDSISIYADKAFYFDEPPRSKAFPQAVMRGIKGGDTLYLSADTLYAINDTVQKVRRFHAFRHAKMHSVYLTGIADSIVYDFSDSTLTFFKDPVLWNDINQLRGDTVRIYIKNKKIDRIACRTRSFMIGQDTVLNYNQIKGKNITGYFKEDKLIKLEVNQNAEVIYYALQGDTITSGINNVNSESLIARFQNKKLKTITFYKEPKGKFIPFHEIKDENTRLKGFKLRFSEKPTIEMVVGKYYSRIFNSKKQSLKVVP